jgi:integrase
MKPTRRPQRSARIERGIARIELPGGGEAFRVQLSGRQVGGRRLSRLCATYAQAQAVKAEWLAGGGPPPDDGDVVPPAPERPVLTVGDAIESYASDLETRGKDAGRVRQLLPVLRREDPALLNQPIPTVTLDHLYLFRRLREGAKKKANTIRRDLGVLRQALKLERPDLKVPDDVFPPANNTRVRVLRPAEEKRARLAVPEPFLTIVRLASLTLMRLSDLRTLRREMVDLGQGVVTLPATKSGPRVVTLGRDAATLLRRQLDRHKDALVFPSPAGVPYSRVHISRVWRRAIRATGRQDFTFHDLKHHGAMKALALGATFPELKDLGGWKSVGMVSRYASATADRIREIQDGIARQPARARRR